jgi:acetyltransferase-like isoleucine patch superfamily enzyme
MIMTYFFLFFSKLINKLFLFINYNILKYKRGVTVLGKLHVKNRPIVDVTSGAEIKIGINVTLNSRNKGYHLNMHSPVKLFADRVGAKISIGDNTRIHGSCIHAYKEISIGSNCLIAANCQIIDSNGHELSFDNVANRINTVGKPKPIKICDNVWIGANSIILPGVTIGEGSIISANSVVNTDIPEMVVAAGNPAKVIKYVKL